jgi:hypothetical protein
MRLKEGQKVRYLGEVEGAVPSRTEPGTTGEVIDTSERLAKVQFDNGWSAVFDRIGDPRLELIEGKPDILTIMQAGQLQVVLEVAQQGAKVAWVDNDGSTVYKGTARHIVKSPDNIGFLGRNDEVRDAYLRITMQGGLENFIKVRDVMELVAHNEFNHYDW